MRELIFCKEYMTDEQGGTNPSINNMDRELFLTFEYIYFFWDAGKHANCKTCTFFCN